MCCMSSHQKEFTWVRFEVEKLQQIHKRSAGKQKSTPNDTDSGFTAADFQEKLLKSTICCSLEVHFSADNFRRMWVMRFVKISSTCIQLPATYSAMDFSGSKPQDKLAENPSCRNSPSVCKLNSDASPQPPIANLLQKFQQQP